MIKPVQLNSTAPNFKGFINLSDRDEMVNTRYIKSVEKSAFGNFTKINYLVNNDFETVSKAVSEADKTGNLIDIKG